MRRSKIVLLVGAVVLAGCAEDGGVSEGLTLSTPPSAAPTTAPVAGPADPTGDAPSVEPTPSAETATPDEAAVLDAYRAFYAALDQAQADPPRSQEYLAPVATGAQFEITNGAIKAAFLEGEEDVGSPVLNPTVHAVDGDTAIVHDCQDTSSVQSRDRATGEVLTIGSNPDSATTVLTRVNGVWRVSATDFPADNEAHCT